MNLLHIMASLEKFNVLAESLLEFEAAFNETDERDLSFFSVEVQREELKSIWVSLKAAYDVALREAKATCGESFENVDSLKASFRNCYNAYVATASQMGEYAHNLTVHPTHSSARGSPVAQGISTVPAAATHTGSALRGVTLPGTTSTGISQALPVQSDPVLVCPSQSAEVQGAPYKVLLHQ